MCLKTDQVRRCTYGQFGSIRLVPFERATSIKSKKRFLILKNLNFTIPFYDFKQMMNSQHFLILLGQRKSNIRFYDFKQMLISLRC